MKDKEIFLHCACWGEGVTLCRWDDEDTIDLAFWGHGIKFDTRWNLKYRIKIAWKILRHGTIYKDFVTLRPNEQEKLRDFMNDICPKD